MGHRALVAYERGDGGFTVRYSHWGAAGFRLCRTLSARTPFGRDPDATPEVGRRTGPGPGPATSTTPTVDRAVIGRASDVQALAREFVDPVIHEAAYVVSTSFDVVPFLPLAYHRPDPGDEPPTGGALVELGKQAADRARRKRDLRAWQLGYSAASPRQGPETHLGFERVESDGTAPLHETRQTADGKQSHDSDFEAWIASLKELVDATDVYPIAPTDPALDSSPVSTGDGASKPRVTPTDGA